MSENCGRSGKIDIVHARRDRDVNSIPVKTKPAGRASRIKRGRIDLFPFRVIEIRAAGVRREVISLDRFAGRLLVWTSGFEIDLNDFGVAITPLTFDKIDTFFCGEIDHGVWFSSRRVGICFRKCATS